MTDQPLSFDTPNFSENPDIPQEAPAVQNDGFFASEVAAPIEPQIVEPLEPIEPQVAAPTDPQPTVLHEDTPFFASEVVEKAPEMPDLSQTVRFEPPVVQYAPVTEPTAPVYQQPVAPTPPTQPTPPTPPTQQTAPRAAAPAKKKKKENWGLRLAIIALVCALLGSALGGLGVGYYLSRQQNNSTTVTEHPGYLRPTTNGTSVESEASTTLAQLYANAVPSIVGITNYQIAYSYFGQSSTATSTGTGFIISANGEIVTNYHVVENAQSLTVTMYDGTVYDAKLLGYEAESDVALLKIEAETALQPLVLGDSDALFVGEQIAAIGNPLGELTYTMTVGYVSAKGRAVYTDEKPINMMQIDAAINSGNSGGPLFNLAGEVVGITTAKYSGSSNGSASIEGIGFAIPINDVLIILDDLREYGSVQNRAFIGGTFTNSIAGGQIPEGALVQSIDKGSAGDKAGLRVSDIILAVGEKKVDSLDALYQALRPYRAGDTVTLTVFRSGDTLELSITFDSAPEVEAEPPANEEPTEEPSYEFPWDFFFP